MKLIRDFSKSESGAVTVDWTVMTAAVVGLGIVSIGAVRTGTGSLAADIQASLSSASVASLLGALNLNDTDGLETTPWGWVARGELQGWFTVGNNSDIEVSRSGQRVTTPDGGNWIDMEYYSGNVTLARVLDNISPGQNVTLSFNAANSNTSNAVDVYFGGNYVETVQPGSSAFTSYSVSLLGGTGDGSNQLELRGTGPEDSVGVSLHGISIQ